MKRIAIILVVVLSIFMNKFEVQAQCGIGFTEKIITMQVGECEYNVRLCVKCIYTPSPYPNEVKLMGFWQLPSDPQCIQTLTYQQVVNYIMSQIQTFDFIRTYLCDLQPTAPPCEQGQLNVKFIQFLCYKWACQLYQGQVITATYLCDSDNRCETTYSYCWISDPLPGHMQKTLISGPTQIGTPNCTLEGWDVIIPTVPGTESECFIHHTNVILCKNTNPTDIYNNYIGWILFFNKLARKN